ALLGKRADALARKFHETHDMDVKDELERLLNEYGELGKPWDFSVISDPTPEAACPVRESAQGFRRLGFRSISVSAARLFLDFRRCRRTHRFRWIIIVGHYLRASQARFFSLLLPPSAVGPN